MKKIIVIGAGGHARSVITAIEAEAKLFIVGLIDNHLPKGSLILGYPVIGDDTCLDQLAFAEGVIVAVGDNWKRAQIVKNIQQRCPEADFFSIVHPYSFVSRDVLMGKGSVVLAGAVINTGTTIGNHCIINTKASVDHDSRLNDFVSIAPGATLGGNVKVGEGSAISLGASVIHNKIIGEHTIVGAGAVVLDDISSRIVVVGIPAKKLRDHIPGATYLW